MASGDFVASCGRLDSRVAGLGTKLLAAGVTGPRVVVELAQAGAEAFAAAVLGESEGELTVADVASVQEFLDSMRRLANLEKAAERACASPALEDSLWAAGQLAKRRRSLEEAPPAAARERVPPPGRRPRALPSRRRADLGPASLGSQDRRAAERAARELGRVLEAAGAPSLRLAGSGEGGPGGALEILLGRSRPSTALIRLRAWSDFGRWLQAERGRAWPANPDDLIDYVRFKVSVAAPPSWPTVFAGAVSWVEARAGFEVRYGADALLKRAVEWATRSLAAEGVPVRKAPRLPVIALVALELEVMDAEVALVVRVGAWVRLVKVYATLRWDDLQRMRPVHLVMKGSGLVGRLLRTKTSGTGKKVRELPVFISRDTWLAEDRWLEEGFLLWKGVLPEDRDFFLPRPNAALDGFGRKVASAEDAALLGKKVMSELCVPVWFSEGGVKRIVKGPCALFPGPLADGWTNHSERSTVPSALAAVGVPRDQRNLLGRWGPDGSDDYVRTHRAVVRDLLQTFVGIVRGGEAFVKLDEEDALEDAGVRGFEFVPDPVAAKEAVEKVAGLAKVFLSGYALREAPAPGPPPVAVPARIEADVGEVSDQEGFASFILAYSGGGRQARLHRALGCWHARTLSFLRYELVDGDLPDPDLYSALCRKCWPDELGGIEVPTSSGTSSSSEASADDVA